jgi:hypothetical protein
MGIIHPQFVYPLPQSRCRMKTQLRKFLPDEARGALAYLVKPWTCAGELNFDPWDFALRLLQLEKLGVSQSDLRWLVSNGYVDQADEVTTYRDAARRFQPRADVAFTAQTCFVLTEAGASLVQDRSDEEDLAPPASLSSTIPFSLPVASASAAESPHWNSQSRVLRFGGKVIKRFRQPSSNQEALLAAFEESGWPERIDDPLPPHGDVDPKQRLHFSIWRLNRHQEQDLLMFRGDGTGEGICWGRVAETDSVQDDVLPLRRAA